MKYITNWSNVAVVALTLALAGCGSSMQEYEVPESSPQRSAPRDMLVGAMGGSMMLLHSALPSLSADRYADINSNVIQYPQQTPVSTFSLDVDTGSYSNVRRFLREGRPPPEDAVRVEEMINYFHYDYPTPTEQNVPFAVGTDLIPTPWNRNSLLLRIAIKAAMPINKRPAANLVFLVDTSGSMSGPDRLPLLRTALRILVRQLTAVDHVAIVTYAGSATIALPATAGDRTGAILAAIDNLEAEGSTYGSAGITTAYQVAAENMKPHGINRVLLGTDGDFNVGITDTDELLSLVKRQRQAGIALTTLGFGRDNLNEQLMERLADAGDGNYAYIDSAQEAAKVLARQVDSTLFTVARDVKVQVEFNPNMVAEYRLIGYENRLLQREDFNNDKVDAGDIGAGHTVTAFYEITPSTAKKTSVIVLSLLVA